MSANARVPAGAPPTSSGDATYHRKLHSYDAFNEYQYEVYRDFAEADGVKWAGSGWAYESIPEGLDDDVYFLAGEPYGAVVAYNKGVSREFLTAADAHGFPSELCGYMVNYWGGLTRDEYVLPDGTRYDHFPRLDFNFTSHLCCTHAKWYQGAAELEDRYTVANDGPTPTYAIDVIGGANAQDDDDVLEYQKRQIREAIDFVQEASGRRFDDRKFVRAVRNELTTMALWAKICALQKNRPAPLEERRMFSLYVPSIARRSTDRAARLYRELHDEVEGLAEEGATVSGPQEFRFISDSPPPWAHLDIYRYFREAYGAVSLGSLYTWGLTSTWRGYEGGDGWDWEPMASPMERGVEVDDRETAIEEMIKANLRKPSWHVFGSDLGVRKEITRRMVEQFDVDFVLIHLNRGCEGWAQNQMGVVRHLKEHGIPVLKYEGNQADTRDFDPSELREKIDAFMEGRFGVSARTGAR